MNRKFIVFVLLAIFVFSGCTSESRLTSTPSATFAKLDGKIVNYAFAGAVLGGAALTASAPAVELKLPTFKSLDELLAQLQPEYQVDMVMESAPVMDAGKGVTNEIASADFSQTNSQVVGVEEGEIVKTDGKYIYTAIDSSVAIVSIDQSVMHQVSSIGLKDIDIAELYVVRDRMLVIGHRTKEQILPKLSSNIRSWWNPEKHSEYYTVYTVYDIKDRSNPKIMQELEVKGHSLATRVIGERLYYAVKYTPMYIPWEAYADEGIEPKSEWFIPSWKNSVTRTKEVFPAVNSISYFPDATSKEFLTIGSLDLTGKDKSEPKTYFGGGEDFYMNTEMIVIANNNWQKNGTDLYKFELSDSNIAHTGKVFVKGWLLDQYAMDAFDGMFRCATTDWQSGNNLFILDSDLKILGSVEGLAKGESIKSVRFMERMAYVVTFRNTDPLFAISLENPQKPEVLGELKLPGFSQYLHPIGDGLLVGFGRDTEEIGRGFEDIGAKISLFDISNPREPREISKLLYSGELYHTEAFENPRLLMVDPIKKIFAFPVVSLEANPDLLVELTGTFETEEDYLKAILGKIWYGSIVLQVKDGKLVELSSLEQGRFTYEDYKAVESASYYDTPYAKYTPRTLYVKDKLYLVGAKKITAFDYASFKNLGTITLD